MASKRKRKPWKVQEPVARYNMRRIPCAMTEPFARSNRSAYVSLRADGAPAQENGDAFESDLST